MGTQGRGWTWTAWLLLLIGAAAVVIIIATPVRSQTYQLHGYYPTPTAYANGNYLTLSLYGAGFVPAADTPAQQSVPAGAAGTDNADLIRELIREQKETQRLLKRLLEIAEAAQRGEDAPPATGTKPPDDEAGDGGGSDGGGLVMRSLSKEESGAVVRKLKLSGPKMMPPLDSGYKLTAAERANFVAAFSNQKYNSEQLSASLTQCSSCHSSTVNYRKVGGGFAMFERETQSRK